MTNRAPEPVATLRRARAEDAAALYAIALATGDHGADATALFRDPDLLGAVFVAPYLAHGLVLVAEDSCGVAGYVAGVADTRAFEAAAAAGGRPARAPAAVGSDLERRLLERLAAPQALPAGVVATHPAHLHLNIHPRAQGRGLGPRLARAWLAAAAAEGARAAHVAVSRRNPRGERFWRRVGFQPLPPVEDPAFALAVWLGRDAG